MREPPLIVPGRVAKLIRVDEQSMGVERHKDGSKTFRLYFEVTTYEDRLEATIAAVAAEPGGKEKGGHLSIDFLESKTTEQGTDVVRRP